MVVKGKDLEEQTLKLRHIFDCGRVLLGSRVAEMRRAQSQAPLALFSSLTGHNFVWKSRCRNEKQKAQCILNTS